MVRGPYSAGAGALSGDCAMMGGVQCGAAWRGGLCNIKGLCGVSRAGEAVHRAASRRRRDRGRYQQRRGPATTEGGTAGISWIEFFFFPNKRM